MPEEKFSTKFFAFGGSVSSDNADPVDKHLQHAVTGKSDDIVEASNEKIMTNFSNVPDKLSANAKSDYDELKTLIKKWRNPDRGRTLYPFTASSGPTSTSEQMEAVVGSRRDPRTLSDMAAIRELYRDRNAPMIVWITDPDGACTFLGKSWYDFIGPTPDTRVGSGWLDAVHPDHQAYVQDRVSRFHVQREAFRIEFRLHCKDGEFRWGAVAGTPRFAADGRFLGYIGSVVDKTEHNQGTEEVCGRNDRQMSKAVEPARQSETRFQAIADAAPFMIWMSNPDSLCTWFNKPWLNFVGRTMEQELGTAWMGSVHTEDVALCFDTYTEACAVRLPFTRSYRLKGHDGEYRWVLDKAIPLFAPTGCFSGYMGCCIDITEQKKIEEALRESNRLKDEFLANLSHEIRSPMTSILTCADMLLAHLNDRGDIECVKTIKQGGNHLMELISDILDLCKIGSGKLKINRTIVSLPGLLNEVHSLMAVRAQEKKLPLVLTYEGVVPENIESDRTRLRQILLNLVSNAVKFTAEGSVQIIARFLPHDSVLEIAVVDTGIGIAAEQQQRLFQPFMQASPVAALGHEGTGLGLAITRQLVDMLGGEISFESVPNSGSTFRVRMPVAPVPATAARTANVVKCASSRPRIKIFLVDDNQLVCRSLARLLAMSGCEVATAFDGQSALETAREYQADVAVLDLKLPDMNGYELLCELKKLTTFAHTKFIALTGYGEEFRQNTGVEFDHFLTKPVDTKELEALVGARG